MGSHEPVVAFDASDGVSAREMIARLVDGVLDCVAVQGPALSIVTFPSVISTSTAVTPETFAISSRTAEAQCPQLIPVTVTLTVFI
ncbi:hypothetical protein I552_3997 [Mycobacterium xenopi 3993]|nr:hypothetical protein I552_3997 [Mycobacterium xenopi 3993]